MMSRCFTCKKEMVSGNPSGIGFRCCNIFYYIVHDGTICGEWIYKNFWVWGEKDHVAIGRFEDGRNITIASGWKYSFIFNMDERERIAYIEKLLVLI